VSVALHHASAVALLPLGSWQSRKTSLFGAAVPLWVHQLVNISYKLSPTPYASALFHENEKENEKGGQNVL
jgi:hypothetical protein